jgi:hypothetical protein
MCGGPGESKVYIFRAYAISTSISRYQFEELLDSPDESTTARAQVHSGTVPYHGTSYLPAIEH